MPKKEIVSLTFVTRVIKSGKISVCCGCQSRVYQRSTIFALDEELSRNIALVREAYKMDLSDLEVCSDHCAEKFRRLIAEGMKEAEVYVSIRR